MELKSRPSGRPRVLLRFSLILLISLLALPCLASSSANSKNSSPPKTLVLYLHGFTSLTSDLKNVTAFTIVNAVTNTSAVGYTFVAREEMTEGPDWSSRKLALLSGLNVETGKGLPYSSQLMFATIQYDDGVHKGSLVLQGDCNFTASATEAIVLGGSGDFFGVIGIAIRRPISTNKVGDLLETVAQFTIKLSYRKAEFDS